MPTAIANGQAQQGIIEQELDTNVGTEAFNEQSDAASEINGAQLADSGANKLICDSQETKTRRGSRRQAATAIDSRSILNNKQQLKRFWERRMELDSLRSSRGRETNNNNNKMTPPREQQQGDASERSAIKLASSSSKLMEFSPARDCESPAPRLQDENNNNDAGEQHVSAELLCEKLLAYEQTQAARSAPKAKRKATDKPEVPNQDQTTEASQQPMSINPTLCHVNTTSDDDDEELLDEQQDEEQVANEEFGSSNSSLVGRPTSPRAQTTNQAPKRSRSASLDSGGDSQEETSTQSGSVLTVISNSVKTPLASGDNSNSCAKIELVGEGGRATPTLITSIEDEEDEEEEELQPVESGQSTVSAGESDASNIGVAFESLHFDDEIKSSRSEQVDEERLMAGNGGGGKRPPLSNLPVPVPAPGQVRTTIKLAANDDNDERAARGPGRGDKFSSREVRSVCALITSAISDAGRQVEGYLRSQSNAKVAVAESATAAASAAADESPITPTNQRQRGNHDEGEPTTADEESGFQRATFVREEDSPSPQPARQVNELNGQRVERQVATIGYLADEDEDGDADDDEEEEDDGDERERCASPRADLSSIFEANVRREIERFESNTALRRQQNQPGGCGKKSAGLTEWRIAEEIRLFNERERELKQRCGGAGEMAAATVAPPGGTNTNQQLESIVRFGKTLQIAKPTSEAHQSPATSKSIKLTTKGAGGPSQPATTISMHKFISSGGKRFVYQTVQVNSSSQPLDSGHHLTKSMSNLSTCVPSSINPSGSSPPTSRQVDYRAVDSLKCKEVPNVAPGLAKKTIETFARLNSETSLNKLGVDQPSVGGSMASNLNNGHSPTRATKGDRTRSAMSGNLNNGHTLRPQQPMTHGGGGSGSGGVPTAEWKIQEELREMRAREAELRSLRSQRQPVAAPVKPKQQQRNLIAANVKSLHRQHGVAATELAVNNGAAGKQRPLTRANRFQRGHASHANYDIDDDDDIVEDIHPAHSASRANNNDRDHDNLDSGASGDDESNSEQDGERIRPVKAHGDTGMHSYQRQAANSALVNGRCGGDLAGSSDSLYPIKQTIDSFRKLNQQSASDPNGDCNYQNNNNSGGCGQVSVTSNSSASGELATYRSGQANKKASRQPQGSQRKQFVNSSPVGGPPQTRPT